MLATKTHNNITSFANYCRTGNYNTIDRVIEKNMTHYRRLVFNNILDSLTAAYPLTKKLLKRKEWEKLVNRFLGSHDIQNPQIWMMPKEFKEYVICDEKKLMTTYPFLENLLELEWLEIEVFMMPDIALENPSNPNLYYLNPEIRIIKVEYPVHLKRAKEITIEDKRTYFISIHRNQISGSVHFTNLSIPFVDVLENLLEHPLSEKDIVTLLKKYADDATATKAFQQFTSQSITNHLIFKLK